MTFLCWLLGYCAGLIISAVRSSARHLGQDVVANPTLLHLHLFWMLKKGVLIRLFIVSAWLALRWVAGTLALSSIEDNIAINMLAHYLIELFK